MVTLVYNVEYGRAPFAAYIAQQSIVQHQQQGDPYATISYWAYGARNTPLVPCMKGKFA